MTRRLCPPRGESIDLLRTAAVTLRLHSACCDTLARVAAIRRKVCRNRRTPYVGINRPLSLALPTRIRNSRLGRFVGRHPTSWVSAVLFAISYSLLCLRMYVPFEWGDEGYFANAALRILSGEVIYRDFQHNYPPGRMYVLAFLVKIFGQDLTVVRLFWVFCHSASVAVGYCVARRLMSVPFALLTALAILFNNVHQNKSVEILVSSLVLLTLFRVLERRTTDLAAGAALGVLAYFRHDVATMGLLLFYLQMYLQALVADDGATHLDRLRRRSSEGWKFLFGFVLAGTPFVLFLLAQGAFGHAFHDLILAGFEANVALSKPFPPLFTSWDLKSIWQGVRGDAVVFYTPPLVYGACTLYAVRSLRGGGASLRGIQILVCAVFGALVYTQVIPRTDAGHLNKAYIPAHILSFVLISLTTGAFVSNLVKRRFALALLFAIIVVPAAAIPIAQFAQSGNKPEALHEVLFTELGFGPPFHVIELARGRYKTRGEFLARRMRNINEKILAYQDGREDEFMLAYPAGAIFNFLYDYKNPVAYDVLRLGELGGNDTEIVQKILQRVEATKPRVMIRIFEGTNPELGADLTVWAKNAGYTRYPLPRLAVWIRSDSRAERRAKRAGR